MNNRENILRAVSNLKCRECNIWVGQKVHLGFSVDDVRKNLNNRLGQHNKENEHDVHQSNYCIYTLNMKFSINRNILPIKGEESESFSDIRQQKIYLLNIQISNKSNQS